MRINFLYFIRIGLVSINIKNTCTHMLANTLYTEGKKIIFDTILQFSSVHSVISNSDPMDHSMPGLPVHHQLLEFTQTHVH